MVRELWRRLDRLDRIGLGFVAVILVGLFLRNAADASSSLDVLRAVAAVFVLALVVGYRVASRHLSTRRSGLLLVGVALVAAGVVYALSPDRQFDRDLVAALGAAFVVGAGFVLASYVDWSTRRVGAAWTLAGAGVVAAEFLVFEAGSGALHGAFLVVLGILALFSPETVEGLGGNDAA